LESSVIGKGTIFGRAVGATIAFGLEPLRGLGKLGQLSWLECGSGSSAHRSGNQKEGTINRYQIGWDADAKADWHDTAAGTPGSAASTRQSWSEQDANWDSSSASQSGNIAT